MRWGVKMLLKENNPDNKLSGIYYTPPELASVEPLSYIHYLTFSGIIGI